MDDKTIAMERSEEVEDIIGNISNKGSKWTLLIIFSLAILLLLFGYIIKYPMVISGEIKIITQNEPARLVAKSSGRLFLLNKVLGDTVIQGEIIAVIANSTDINHFVYVDSLVNLFELNDTLITKFTFPHNVNLGELNRTYYSFISSYFEYINKYNLNIYILKEQNLKSNLSSMYKNLHYMERQMDIKREQMLYINRELSRDSLSLKLETLSERALDSRHNQINQLKETFLLTESAYDRELNLIEELQNQCDQLEIEKLQYISNLRTTLRNTYNELRASMLQWKEQYAFIAPFRGSLVSLGFWRDNKFIISGQEIFSIVPNDNIMVGQMLLPSHGAGKVKVGQDVSIKLNDFPYLEYGTIDGTVGSISKMANTINTANTGNPNSTTDLYFVIVNLPNGITSKFGTDINFKHEINGVADIKTVKRRLIQRLFDNIRYITN